MLSENKERELKKLAKKIRINIVETIHSIGVGHIGGSLSIADVLAVLYGKYMRVDPSNPQKPGRDRLVCSKGHAGPAMYAVLAEMGYFPKEELQTLNKFDTKLPSHCDMNKTPGIDMTAGSLGQGLSCAVGMALASTLARDGATIYAIIGDGESQEGQIWEAAMFAGNQPLSNLIVFTDYNKLQLDGYTKDINDLDPLTSKWKAFNWNVIELEDGNDIKAIDEAIESAKKLQDKRDEALKKADAAKEAGAEPKFNPANFKPTMIILNTVKGKGVKEVEGAGTGNHSMTITQELYDSAMAQLGAEVKNG